MGWNPKAGGWGHVRDGDISTDAVVPHIGDATKTGSPTQDGKTITLAVPSGGAATDDPADWPIGALWRMRDVNGKEMSITATQLLPGFLQALISTLPSLTSDIFVVVCVLDSDDLATASGMAMRVSFTSSTVQVQMGAINNGTTTWGTAAADVDVKRAFGSWNMADDAFPFNSYAAGYGNDWETREAIASRNLNAIDGGLRFGVFGGLLGSSSGGTIAGRFAYAPTYVFDLDSL